MKIIFIPLLIDLLIKIQFEQTIICEANKLIMVRLKKFKYKGLFHHCSAYSAMTALAKSGGWKMQSIKSASVQLFSYCYHVSLWYSSLKIYSWQFSWISKTGNSSGWQDHFKERVAVTNTIIVDWLTQGLSMRVLCYIFGFCPTIRKWLCTECFKEWGQKGRDKRREWRKQRRKRGGKERLTLPKLLGELC